MPETVDRYADKAYVKGQYYRYAAAPKPFVFTGNIDTVSDELLVRAMFVTRDQVSGTLPEGAINNFLIETIRYGNDTYLQTAYAIQAGFDCYEYRRIYSGAWTEWVGVDSAIAGAVTKADNAVTAANEVSQAITGKGGINEQISGINRSLTSMGSSITGISNDVSSLSGSVRTLNTKTTITDISNSYIVEKTGGDSKFSFGSIEASKVGNVVSMKFIIHMSSSSSSNTWSVGTNLFKGKINSGSLPTQAVRLISYYGPSILLCNIEANGDITVRVFGSALTIGNRSDDISHTGVFMVAN